MSASLTSATGQALFATVSDCTARTQELRCLRALDDTVFSFACISAILTGWRGCGSEPWVLSDFILRWTLMAVNYFVLFIQLVPCCWTLRSVLTVRTVLSEHPVYFLGITVKTCVAEPLFRASSPERQFPSRALMLFFFACGSYFD